MLVMIICPQCGYENLDDALYCNLCKKIFRKEKKTTPSDEKEISSIHDLPPEIRELLQKQKVEIMHKFQEDSLSTIRMVKKGCILCALIGLGVIALILLHFFFTIPVR